MRMLCLSCCDQDWEGPHGMEPDPEWGRQPAEAVFLSSSYQKALRDRTGSHYLKASVASSASH